MLRLGVVGAGFVGQIGHLRHYDRIDACDVVALVERRPKLRERVATRYEIDATYATPGELLGDVALDAIVAVHPFERHGELCPPFLERGLPLFTEKALAVRVETGERLVAMAEANDTIHAIGYQKRSDPAVMRALRTVERWRMTGEVGDLQHVRITAPSGDWRSGAPAPITTGEEIDEKPLESPPPEFDGGAASAYHDLINVYSHQLNLLRAVMGDYEVTFADDAGHTLVAGTDDGVTGVLEMDPYATSRDWQESLVVGFEHGSVRVSFPAPMAAQTAGRVEIMHDGGDSMETRQPALPATSPLRAQAEHFVAAARGDRDPVCDSREALADLRTAREYVRKRF